MMRFADERPMSKRAWTWALVFSAAGCNDERRAWVSQNARPTYDVLHQGEVVGHIEPSPMTLGWARFKVNG